VTYLSDIYAALSDIYLASVAPGVPRRALWTAIVVGIILNLINQGDALVSGGRMNWFKAALTFVVPYFVATYGAVAFQLSAKKK
jgi:hypothetical protein